MKACLHTTSQGFKPLDRQMYITIVMFFLINKICQRNCFYINGCPHKRVQFLYGSVGSI